MGDGRSLVFESLLFVPILVSLCFLLVMDVCTHMGPIHFGFHKFGVKARGERSHSQYDLSRYGPQLNMLATCTLIRGSASAGVEL